MLMDVTGTFLYGNIRRRVYIRLPPEETQGQPVVGRLIKALYGLRDAPLIWKAHLAQSLKGIGFTECPVMPGVFRHSERSISLGVHVDDIMAMGAEKNLLWVYEHLCKLYDMKYSLVGPGHKDSDVFL